MTVAGWASIAVFVAILAALTKPVGLWLFALYEGLAQEKRYTFHRRSTMSLPNWRNAQIA